MERIKSIIFTIDWIEHVCGAFRSNDCWHSDASMLQCHHMETKTNIMELVLSRVCLCMPYASDKTSTYGRHDETSDCDDVDTHTHAYLLLYGCMERWIWFTYNECETKQRVQPCTHQNECTQKHKVWWPILCSFFIHLCDYWRANTNTIVEFNTHWPFIRFLCSFFLAFQRATYTCVCVRFRFSLNEMIISILNMSRHIHAQHNQRFQIIQFLVKCFVNNIYSHFSYENSFDFEWCGDGHVIDGNDRSCSSKQKWKCFACIEQWLYQYPMIWIFKRKLFWWTVRFRKFSITHWSINLTKIDAVDAFMMSIYSREY